MSESVYRNMLKGYVEQALHELDNAKEFYTEGTKLALADMVHQAEAALNGTGAPPFARSRKFYAPREDEAVLFATKRFTMAPTYRQNSNIHYYYGLEPALEWFRKQHMLYGGRERLRQRAELCLEKADELMLLTETGPQVGQYNAAARSRLEESLGQLRELYMVNSENTNEDCHTDIHDRLLGQAVVRCFNAIRVYRFSKVLRTDVDAESGLYFTKEGFQLIKERVLNDPLLHAQYEQIQEIADSHTLAYIKNASWLLENDTNYDKVNLHYYAWSYTDKIINFAAPAETVQAQLSFVLPAEENEADGLGHVWIDNVSILSANGAHVQLPNSGFDEGITAPSHWKAEMVRGNPILRWEGSYPYSGGGEPPAAAAGADISCCPHSIYICNPTAHDEGAWTTTGPLAMEGDTAYTLTFAAKLDGKLKQGLKAVIRFIDRDHQVLDTFEYRFNRKSWLPNCCFELTMQCDAIQYAFTGNLDYALKAKHEILYTLHDFCQGAEHWLTMNSRPEGSDFFGAVQGGRLLCVTAVTYSLIKAADVFTADEKASLYAMTDYLLRYMLDLRDRTELSQTDASHNCSNWQTDMCAGTAYMMLVLDDFPNRKTWLYNADMVLRSQLMTNVNADSSWPESIRYHHAVLERLASYAKVLEHVTGDDWFHTTPLADMFDYGIEMQTPGYRFFDGRIGTPPFGDHALGGGGEFGLFATYLADIEKLNKPLADRMYHTWCMAGKPFKGIWRESIALDNLLGMGDTYTPAEPLTLQSTRNFPNAGIYIFRKQTGEGQHSYCAIMSSPKPISHGHLDQGSFIIYKNSIPIVMDSGIEGYFDSSTQWHISSYSHACLQFATQQTEVVKQNHGAINLSAGTYSLERGWVDVPRTSQVLECTLGPHIESITIEIANPEGQGRHIRRIWYAREQELYIIHDQIMQFQGEVLFSLPVAAAKSIITGNQVYSKGVYDIDLETTFLTPVKRIGLEQGRSTVFFNNNGSSDCMMDYIRAVADAQVGFAVVLYPKERAARRIAVTQDGSGFTVSTSQGKTIHWSATAGININEA